MQPLKFEEGLQSCSIKARKCPFIFFKYQTGPARQRLSGATVPPGLEFLHHILLRPLHGVIQEHSSSLLLPNLNLKGHQDTTQKCGIPNWPRTRKRHFSLNCSSVGLPGLHSQLWGCSSHPRPRSQPCPQPKPHIGGRKPQTFKLRILIPTWPCHHRGSSHLTWVCSTNAPFSSCSYSIIQN